MSAAEVLVDDVASTTLRIVRRPHELTVSAFGQALEDLEALGFIRNCGSIDIDRVGVERLRPPETRARSTSLPLGSATSHPADAPTEPDPREGPKPEVAHVAARVETRDVVSSDEASEHPAAVHAADVEMVDDHTVRLRMPKNDDCPVAVRVRELIAEGVLTTEELVKRLGEEHKASVHVTTAKLVREGVLKRGERGKFTFHGWTNGSGAGKPRATRRNGVSVVVSPQEVAEDVLVSGLELALAKKRAEVARIEKALAVLRGG